MLLTQWKFSSVVLRILFKVILSISELEDLVAFRALYLIISQWLDDFRGFLPKGDESKCIILRIVHSILFLRGKNHWRLSALLMNATHLSIRLVLCNGARLAGLPR